MPVYKVTLLTPDGEMVEEVVEAANEEELLTRYLNTDLLLLGYKKEWLGPFLRDFTLSSVSVEELADFCFYVGRALETGVSVLEVLEDLEKSAKNPKLRKAVARVKERLMAGSTLSEAMAPEKIFPPQLVGLVKIGENSDALPQVFLNYASYLDWLSKLRKEVKQALSYPAFVSLVMVGVIAIMFGYIIPQIIPALKAMGLKEYPLPTKILLWTGKYVPLYWKWILACVVGLPLLFTLAVKHSKKFRYYWDRLKLKLPYVGEILLKSSLSRDIRAIAEIYRSGGTILAALDIVINSVEQNAFVKEKLGLVRTYLLNGDMLSIAMEKTGFFPRTVVRMVKLGESTGTLDETLNRIAFIFEDDMKRKIEALTVIIEPALQLMLGLILGIIALGILLPVYDTISSIGMR